MNRRFTPGACKNTKSHLSMAYLFSVRICPTLAMCFFSWSLRIWEPIEYICDPLCLSLFNCLYPAFFRQTYFLSDLCKTHFPSSKIPNEKDPPKHRITAIRLQDIPFKNSSSKFIISNLAASSFFFSIFYSICFCLFLNASGEVKSTSVRSPSNISAYMWVLVSSCKS